MHTELVPSTSQPQSTNEDAAPTLTYSVVIPVLNEEGNVNALAERITAVLEPTGEPFEIIFIDDGSSDETPALLRALTERFAHVRVVQMARNYGQEAAVQVGILSASGEWVIQMDGDLQNPPEELPKLLVKLEEGYEIVYGVRTGRKDPIHRVVASKAMMFVMQRVLGIELPEDVTTFRIIRADIARFIARLPEKRKFFSALAVWSGAKSVSVPVSHAAREHGTTKYNIFALINHTYDLMVSFSVRPLRLMGLVGATFAVCGIGFAMVRIAQKVFGADVALGWTSLFSAIVIIGGLQLIALSIIGEYIARIFIQVQDRPLYRVGETLNFPAPDTDQREDA